MTHVCIYTSSTCGVPVVEGRAVRRPPTRLGLHLERDLRSTRTLPRRGGPLPPRLSRVAAAVDSNRRAAYGVVGSPPPRPPDLAVALLLEVLSVLLTKTVAALALALALTLALALATAAAAAASVIAAFAADCTAPGVGCAAAATNSWWWRWNSRCRRRGWSCWRWRWRWRWRYEDRQSLNAWAQKRGVLLKERVLMRAGNTAWVVRAI